MPKANSTARVVSMASYRKIDEGLVEILEEILAAARRGEGDGLFGIFTRRNGTFRVVTRGALTADPERAARITSQALDALCIEADIRRPRSDAR